VEEMDTTSAVGSVGTALVDIMRHTGWHRFGVNAIIGGTNLSRTIDLDIES
jgi:hypothetical protein